MFCIFLFSSGFVLFLLCLAARAALIRMFRIFYGLDMRETGMTGFVRPGFGCNPKVQDGAANISKSIVFPSCSCLFLGFVLDFVSLLSCQTSNVQESPSFFAAQRGGQIVLFFGPSVFSASLAFNVGSTSSLFSVPSVVEHLHLRIGPAPFSNSFTWSRCGLAN